MASQHEGMKFVQQALQAGADGYLSKNSEPEELSLAIDAIVRGDSYLSPKVANGFMARAVRGEAPTDEASPLSVLTPREREVFQLLAVGKANKEVAAVLGLSLGTIKKHRENLQRKLDCHRLPRRAPRDPRGPAGDLAPRSRRGVRARPRTAGCLVDRPRSRWLTLVMASSPRAWCRRTDEGVGAARSSGRSSSCSRTASSKKGSRRSTLRRPRTRTPRTSCSCAVTPISDSACRARPKSSSARVGVRPGLSVVEVLARDEPAPAVAV